jgi:hypothetical protein
MILMELFKPRKIIVEGGNLEIDNPDFDPTQPESPNNTKVIQAQEIQLAPTEISDKVQDRTHMVGVLKTLFIDINKTFASIYKTQLFNPAILDKEIKDFMAGSSQHFFDLLRPNPQFNPKQPESEHNPKMIGISDEEFKKYKPKVGDIDIQCNQELQDELLEFLTNHVKRPIGNEVLLGPPSSGNEQYNTLWQLLDPPIKVQIDFEYGRYSPLTQKPDEWTKFSHSSAWEDIQQGIKGVFHKYIYRALAKAAPEPESNAPSKTAPKAKYIARLSGLGKKRAMAVFGGDDGKEQVIDINNPPPPFIDPSFSFSVASKGGGGLRAKYKPIDPGLGFPTKINGIPVMQELQSTDSNYEQDLNKQFSSFFGRPPQGNDRKLQDSFVGTLELMNKYLDDNSKRIAVSDFFNIVFEPGSQMLTKNDPKRDYATKFAAIDKMLEVLDLQDMAQTAETMAREYEQDYLDVEAFKKDNPNEKRPRAAMKKQKATVKEEAEVKAQLRKGMPHLHDLKSSDFLDLLDEIHDGNGNFKLQNIPLNVKVDGFGGRFGKNAEGKPFMGTSRTEPRYQASFVAYHKQKGTTDPEILGRAQLFDQLFNEMMNAVKLVDSKLGPDFLVNKQVTCEVLYLPFATETPEGKLKFVGIHYDKLPEGVQLALVPFRIVDATTGEDLPDSNRVIKDLLKVGSNGSVMFIDNSLTQKEGLDVTALVPPLENIEQMKAMLASKKRDQAAEVKASLEPVKAALEKAIIEDPNIIGKDLLGQDYEGIVINSRLGPIKVTSQEQRDVITAKNAAKANARTERPRGEVKTAVVAIGSFVGHIGHEELFDYTVKKAAAVGGDPYLFIGNAQGKDDPIPPAVKVQTWHKLYPDYAKNISTVTQDGGSLIQKIKHELINPLPGKPPRYDNIIIMVGEDQSGLTMPQALMKAVNKFQGYEHVKVTLEPTPRGTGMSFTKLRNILKDQNATEQQQFALWSQAFDVNKLGIEWIKHLMDITRKGMGIQEPQQPVQQQQSVPVAEQRVLNALIEGTSIDSTLRAIINDIGEPITSVYDTMKFQAKKYMENHGELGRGFRMVAAGVGGRWVQNMYVGRLHNELYDLCKYNTRRTVDLRDFLRGEETANELEMKRSFGNIANNLPPILAKLGEQINAPQLTRNAQRWMQNKAEYERYLMDLEADGDEPDDAPVVKPSKSTAVGQQNTQVDKIVNDVLSKLPKSIAGDIRNAIARAPNKLAALKQEIDARHLKLSENKNVMKTVAKGLTGKGAPIAKAAAQRDKKREQHGAQSHGRAEGPKWNVAEESETQQQVRAAISKGLAVHKQKGDAEYKTRLDRSNKVGTVPGYYFDATGYASDKLTGIDSIDPDGTVVISLQDTDAEGWVKKLAALGGMPGVKTRQLQSPTVSSRGVAEGSEDPQSELKLINQKLKDAYKQVSKNSSVSIGWYMSEVKALKARREELIKQLRQGVAEGGGQQAAVAIAKRESGKYTKDGKRLRSAKEDQTEARMSAAQRLWNAEQKQRAKSDASLARTPSSIPKPEPKKDEKVAEKLKTGPAAHFTPKDKHVKRGQFVGGDAGESIEEKIKGADGKACWNGYRYNGTENGSDKCVKVSEDVENKMASLITLLENK